MSDFILTVLTIFGCLFAGLAVLCSVLTIIFMLIRRISDNQSLRDWNEWTNTFCEIFMIVIESLGDSGSFHGGHFGGGGGSSGFFGGGTSRGGGGGRSF